MKRRLGLLLCALLLLSGCRPAPAEQSPPPAQTLAPMPRVMTSEEAAKLYTQFLEDKVPCQSEDRLSYFSDFSRTWWCPLLPDLYVRDLTGDGLPELYGAAEPWSHIVVWSIQEGKLAVTESNSSYDRLLANGGIFSYVSGTVQAHVYSYHWLSPESRELPELQFEAYDTDGTWGDELFFLDGVEVTEEEWKERTAPYFALRDAEPTEEQQAIPFLDWLLSLGLPLPEKASLEPWQEAYRDILLRPEEYEEFYAVAEHIPTAPYKREYISTWDTGPYRFAVCDVNGDGVQELLLRDNGLLLNILRYNETTGMAEDMDGPRTYPLKDTLFFYDTGYFGTINGAGGLYTEYWRLEEEDPDRYWYGYQRPYDSDYDGPRTTEIISFYSSDGEEFTLREYYERMGESGVTPSWQEITEGAVLRALLAADGKETP